MFNWSITWALIIWFTYFSLASPLASQQKDVCFVLFCLFVCFFKDYIRSKIDQGKYVGMLLLDVQKAFDSVNHDILCYKVEAMCIKSAWLKSYPSYWHQLVSVDGVQSDFMQLSCGLPQGSLLGSLLYLCYSNDMVTSVKNKLLLYADDR